MPTVRLKLKKLTDVDVEFVSLVKRGANRIPIRVVKSEDVNETSEGGMKFLESLFNSKEEESKGTITSILLKEGSWNEVVEQELVKLGFSIEEKEQVKEGFMFKQEGFNDNDVIIQLNDHAFITVSNVNKSFEPFSTSGSFSDNFKRGGFFPNVRMATDVLMDTVVNIMFSSDGDKVPVESVTKALDEFKNFVLTALKSIPKDAFKVEEIVDKAIKSVLDDDNKKAEQKTEDTVDKETIKKQVEEFLTTEQEQVLAKLEDMKKGIESALKSIKDEVTSKIEKMEGELKTLKDMSEGFDKKLVETTEKMEGIEKTVKGATASGSIDGDAEQTQKDDVKKGDDVWDGLMSQLDNFNGS